MNSDIAIVIPAAGSSSRLGQPKQLVEFAGNSLIRRACEAALEAASHVVVVVGCEDVAVRSDIEDLPVFVVDNPDWEKGMGKSIAIGVQAAMDQASDLAGILIHLCDLPLIDGQHLNKLIGQETKTGAKIVFTKYHDTYGVPALFGQGFYEEMLFFDDDRGAKQLIDGYDSSLRSSVEFKGRFADIDTAEDLGDFEG